MPVIVMSRVPWEPLGSAPLNLAQVRGVGQTLRHMYTAVPAQELAGVAERHCGAEELVDEPRSWVDVAHGPVSPVVDSALRAAHDWANGPQSTALSGPLVERVFTNADGNIGNFVWDGERCCLVDFEDCGVSDRAFEVADLVEHVSVSLPGLLDAEALVPFLASTSQQRQRLVRYRRPMAMYWLLMLVPGNVGHHRNSDGSLSGRRIGSTSCSANSPQ